MCFQMRSLAFEAKTLHAKEAQILANKQPFDFQAVIRVCFSGSLIQSS